MRCAINGVVLREASTQQVAFSFEQIIAELSWGMTLRAGDIVLTGTPSGIGNACEPQVFLRPGDEVVTEVSSLGALRNPMAPSDLSGYRG
ncbi:2-keto-4-pentenoate hydratase/2-oxohepta-3-ene-1,7-dioic acid hydratase in catechol pathway [Prauserella sediminis]|uniref:2-keto-4-pentenoate hydratase/2-oxohepta-3-ene-1,7-dioic acid hydratase in catechol pathway n=1 Tax=Prauserella sediminis TaxID=577680 RepID=A0A839XVW8_9PSEU|nr:2-keto-4-pentenoate hydratase/2-oxohepta-3-ene-1,7-dioic acid hydratase in catechol pathway [Prauserella sediminis]